MKAEYKRRSGFSDDSTLPQTVTILGFVEATILPGYQRSGDKRCVVAVIADEGGYLDQAELCDLRLIERVQ